MNEIGYEHAEYTRLATEMAEDARWQLQFFVLGITAASVVLTFILPRFEKDPTPTLGPLPIAVFFLVPLAVLIPTSYVVFNRARARNRKAAYLIVFVDTRRLADQHVDRSASTEVVRAHPTLPWETALHLLDRGPRPHLPPAILAMGLTYLAVESFCLGLAYVTLPPAFEWHWPLLIVVGVLWVASVADRTVAFLRLRGVHSIQGYVRSFLRARGVVRAGWPQYLREWIDRWDSKSDHAAT